MPPELLQRWSSRRAVIVARQSQLAALFERDHGRPPTPVEAIKLAQQATLETRDANHEPRSAVQQRSTWRAEARQVVGKDGIHSLVAAATTAAVAARPVTAGWVAVTARQVVSAIEGGRATWQVRHLRAEASRRVRKRATARLDNTLEAEIRRITNIDLLIVDDFALRPLDPTQTKDFYEIVVERHRRASTSWVSNREPVEWLGMTTDAFLAQSAVDHLTSGAHTDILIIEGPLLPPTQPPRP